MKMMCVVAHPDDECFAFGGALALAASSGVQVYVVCLTDGQAASNRGDAASGHDLGQMRRAEFKASCAVLGVSRCELLDYEDGKLEFANFSEVAGRLVERIREFRPDVVLTFGSDGAVNTHPDHTMVSAFTSAAFHWAGSEKRYPDAGPVFRAARLYVLSTSYFMEGRPTPMPIPWTTVIDIREVMDVKQEAFRQHESQAPLMEQTKEMFRKFGQSEYYTLAASHEPQAAEVTSSLFEGMTG